MSSPSISIEPDVSSTMRKISCAIELSDGAQLELRNASSKTERGERLTSSASPTDDADTFAGLDVEVDSLQHSR
jgi:hypothetical protein